MAKRVEMTIIFSVDLDGVPGPWDNVGDWIEYVKERLSPKVGNPYNPSVMIENWHYIEGKGKANG